MLLRCRFIRFPGGCYVEGDRLANSFYWKKSIGPAAERPGHWNLWGYWSTDGEARSLVERAQQTSAADAVMPVALIALVDASKAQCLYRGSFLMM